MYKYKSGESVVLRVGRMETQVAKLCKHLRAQDFEGLDCMGVDA